jgi:hypothetical protein
MKELVSERDDRACNSVPFLATIVNELVWINVWTLKIMYKYTSHLKIIENGEGQ